jgi:CBS domain containing-hemolysin-like protein
MILNLSKKNNLKVFWSDICTSKLELKFFSELAQQFIFYNLIIYFYIYICIHISSKSANFIVNYLRWFGLIFSTFVVFLYILKLAYFIDLIFGVNLKKPKNCMELF